MKDKVSIIIPVYNTPKDFLDECINSIVNQTYRNIEIIIVDDGSKEEVAGICESYKAIDDRICVVHQKNQGVSAARNNGIDKASGEWILFVDSDDYLKNNAVEILINESNDAEIIISRTKVNIQGNVYGLAEKRRYNKTNNEELIKGIFSTRDSLFSYIDGLWSKLYSLQFLKKMNLKFKTDLSFGEDVMFNITAYSLAENITYIPDVLYIWRRDNEESVTRKYNPKLREKLTKLISYIDEEFERKKIKLDRQIFLEYISKVIKNIVFMQVYHPNNNCSNKEKKEILKQLVSDKYYAECINNVEIRRLHTDRKIIIYALRSKCYFLINILMMVRKIKHLKNNGGKEK